MSDYEKLVKYEIIIGMIREAVNPDEIAKYRHGEQFAVDDVRSCLRVLDKMLQEVE